MLFGSTHCCATVSPHYLSNLYLIYLYFGLSSVFLQYAFLVLLILLRSLFFRVSPVAFFSIIDLHLKVYNRLVVGFDGVT